MLTSVAQLPCYEGAQAACGESRVQGTSLYMQLGSQPEPAPACQWCKGTISKVGPAALIWAAPVGPCQVETNHSCSGLPELQIRKQNKLMLFYITKLWVSFYIATVNLNRVKNKTFKPETFLKGWRKRPKGNPAAAAKSLQSCPTLCNPVDSSPPGSSVPGILQARRLEWVAISGPPEA